MKDLSFEKVLRDEVESSIEDIALSTRKRPMAAGSKFVDIVIRVVRKLGAEQLKNLDKETALSVVGTVYDDFVAKIDLPGEYDVIIHGLIKQSALAALAIGYDQFMKK